MLKALRAGEKDRSKEDQSALFKGQIELASRYNLPLIIHAREAVDEVIEILSSFGDGNDARIGKRLADTSDLTERRYGPRNPNRNRLKGVFHCYAGGKKRIMKILTDLEQISTDSFEGTQDKKISENPPAIRENPRWYFGIDGNLTYDQGLEEVVKHIPEDRILIETDSPFLAPAPHRGETNYPYYLPLIQQKINAILGKDLTKQIAANTQRLFFS